jgi:hypothetical protein
MGPAKALTRRYEASSARTSRDELARSERTAPRSTRTLDTHLSNADQTTTTVLVPSRKELEGAEQIQSRLRLAQPAARRTALITWLERT